MATHRHGPFCCSFLLNDRWDSTVASGAGFLPLSIVVGIYLYLR